MIANSAFLAAMAVLLLLFLLMDQLSFLIPYKRLLVVFVNLFALFYAASRRLFLKDTGRKLAHVDRQLLTRDAIVRDLSEQLSREE